MSGKRPEPYYHPPKKGGGLEKMIRVNIFDRKIHEKPTTNGELANREKWEKMRNRAEVQMIVYRILFKGI